MSATEGRDPVNVSDFIDAGPWSLTQKLMLVLAAMAFAADGLANQVLGVAMPQIISQWGVERSDMAPVAAIGLLGVAIGAIIGGIVGDRFGRRVGLIGSVLLFGAMTVLASQVSDPHTLAGVRFVDGLGIGAAIPNGAALLTETTPQRRRALALAVGMLFIASGGLLSGLLGAALLPTVGWQGLFLFVGVGAIALALIFAAVLPESPNFLAQRPERQRELEKLLRRYNRDLPAGATFTDRPSQPGDRRWTALIGPNLRAQTLGIWFGFFGCLLATYTLFSWLPTMLHGYGFALTQTSTIMSAFNGGAMFGGLLSGFIMQKWGARLPSMAIASAAVLVALSLAFIPVHPDEFTLMLVVYCVLGLLLAGLHNGFYTLAAISYPPVMRASSVGSAAAFGRLGAILSSFTGVITMQLEGTWGFFVFMSIVLAVTCWCISFARPGEPGAKVAQHA
ncbi:MAG: MFS transporter [Hyphomonadaceae bacterium]|nr:MFS transporter [Hyphomonadaceae bacterium]